jgi:hypothetical protein
MFSGVLISIVESSGASAMAMVSLFGKAPGAATTR